jgi:hypothetical protein
MKTVQIKTDYNQLLTMNPAHKSGASLGTHRFQRAVSAGDALKNDCASVRDCTLEAMRT